MSHFMIILSIFDESSRSSFPAGLQKGVMSAKVRQKTSHIILL